MPNVDLRVGDCREELKKLADCSVDSIVTDPPYEIGFMGKGWDATGIAYDPVVWAEAKRVLKPGGFLLAFSGTRTYHRMACAIEDAGFEIRDQIGWLYGSGFPKSRNIGKELAKMPIEDSPEHVESHDDRFAWLAEMEGWGTALKPAQEPICVGRKPMIGTIAQNILKHGTGGLNIAACRVPTDEELRAGAGSTWDSMHGHEGRTREGEPSAEKRYAEDGKDFAMKPGQRGGDPAGRWPANIIHDGSDEVLEAFAQFGEKPGCSSPSTADSEGSIFGGSRTQGTIYPGTGTAARFFYCAKANREDRNDGCQHMEKKPLNWSSGTQNPGSFQAEGTDKSSQNFHPTVKPTELMRYLCTLVTPPGGLVLDPFMGSGSTGRGARLAGFRFIGIELSPEYLAIAAARIAAAERKPVQFNLMESA